MILGLVALFSAAPLFAKDGYTIKVEFKQNIADNYIYLAHYYAKSFPTVYKTDSAKVVNGKTAVFDSRDSVLGGIYMIIYNNNSKITEFLMDNGDQFEMSIDTSSSLAGTTFKNSSVNTSYLEYQKFLTEYGPKRQALMKEYENAKDAKDSQKIQKKSEAMGKELTDYRENYIKKNPNTIMAMLFRALKTPDIPKGPHYKEDGKTIDSNYAYYFYKNNYWNGFDFQDNRLLYSPIYEPRLNEYFNRVILQIPDTINAEADRLIEKARGADEVFKYTLHWLTGNAEKSNVMGMDEVFVYLVEKYYMQGEVFWLDSNQLTKYKERAQKIAPNVLGNPAPELKLQDMWTLKDLPLHTVDAPYTVLIFWSPSCGHCKTEVPLLDSVYNAALKQKGAVIYSVPTDGKLNEIQDFVKEKKITKWIHAVDAHNNSGFRDNYDVYSTPKIYLLDKNKTIIGKGIDHSEIMNIIEFEEKKRDAKKG